MHNIFIYFRIHNYFLNFRIYNFFFFVLLKLNQYDDCGHFHPLERFLGGGRRSHALAQPRVRATGGVTVSGRRRRAENTRGHAGPAAVARVPSAQNVTLSHAVDTGVVPRDAGKSCSARVHRQSSGVRVGRCSAGFRTFALRTFHRVR